jgi:hypothetical protein
MGKFRAVLEDLDLKELLLNGHHIHLDKQPKPSSGPHDARNWESTWGFNPHQFIKYLESLTGDLFMNMFTDCIFNDDHFLALGRDNKFINDGRKIV